LSNELTLAGDHLPASGELQEQQKQYLELVWGEDRQNRLNSDRALQKLGCGRKELTQWCSDPKFIESFMACQLGYIMVKYPKILQKLMDKAESGHVPAISTVFQLRDKLLQALFGQNEGDKGFRTLSEKYIFNMYSTESNDKLFQEASKIIRAGRKMRGDVSGR